MWPAPTDGHSGVILIDLKSDKMWEICLYICKYMPSTYKAFGKELLNFRI